MKCLCGRELSSAGMVNWFSPKFKLQRHTPILVIAKDSNLQIMAVRMENAAAPRKLNYKMMVCFVLYELLDKWEACNMANSFKCAKLVTWPHPVHLSDSVFQRPFPVHNADEENRFFQLRKATWKTAWWDIDFSEHVRLPLLMGDLCLLIRDGPRDEALLSRVRI